MKNLFQYKYILFILLLIILGQQCSKAPLEENKQFSFKLLSDNPYMLNQPNSFPSVRRFILFMDMSHSMISGLCIQDVDGDKNYASKYYESYDPNKNVGDPNDHRASGVDCKVDESRPFDSLIDSKPIDLGKFPNEFLLTHPGVDYTKDRIVVLKSWIESLRQDKLKEGDSIQLMIVPFSGGISQEILDKKLKSFLGSNGSLQFFDIKNEKLDSIVQWMHEEQDFNYSLAKSDDPWRYEKTSMGTSSPGALYKKLYDVLESDMRKLNKTGLLFHTSYQWVHVTDGFITPIKDHIEYVLSSYSPCAFCAKNPSLCTGVCGTMVNDLKTAWGDPEDQDLKQMDFYFGLIESLPNYFGSGVLQTDFVSVQPTRVGLSRPGATPFWESLAPYFKQRGSYPVLWKLENFKSDLKFNSSNNGLVNYRGTHFYIFSPNVRVSAQGKLEPDSDGDGLSDKDEIALGTDPTNPRTNGYCLDSFLATTAFAERCQAFASSKSCDKNLDSDGDSLNECEETLLGTNVNDFDTDGDSFPDFMEWIYGYNPLKNDSEVDTLGDGVLNATKFAAGLPPNAVYKDINPTYLTQYAINFVGNEMLEDSFGDKHWIDLKQILLLNLPVMPGLVSIQNQKLLSVSRVSQSELENSPNAIPIDEQLISTISRPQTNMILVLARMVDVDEPSKIYWQIYKAEVPVPIEIAQPQMDLSQFKLFRTRDQGRGGGE